MLVEPLWRWEKTEEENRDTLVAQFMKLNEARLSYMVAKHIAIFKKYNERKEEWRDTNPPKDAIEQLLELGHWGFPTAKGISNCPIMRRDGSLFDKPGYDPRTQLWYKPPADLGEPITIPKKLTRADAEKALKTLKHLLSGFPFRDDKGVSESVGIAAMMTPVLRGAYEHAPAILILAPESGTGKTYLVTTASMIATGRAPMAIVGCKNEEEMEKRLSAAAIAGMPITSLNNLTFNLESALLNQMITEPQVGIRLFGRNDQIISCDCRGTTVFINGNNILIVGDLVRRVLTSHLDAKMENPEEKKYKFDPIELVRKDRGKYLAAIFTIARAYIDEGEPAQGEPPLNGFEGWTRMVRRPLIWLGLPDPVVSMKEARADDPERAALRMRHNVLLNIYGTKNGFKATDVHRKTEEQQQTARGFPEWRYKELRSAFADPRGNMDARSIGKLLTKDLGRRSSGYLIERIETDAVHGHTYKIMGEKPEGEKEGEGEKPEKGETPEKGEKPKGEAGNW